jgi:hypothetical protein
MRGPLMRVVRRGLIPCPRRPSAWPPHGLRLARRRHPYALAGTITFRTTYVGLPEKLSITLGPTLSRDAGTVTFVDVFEYTGDPDDPVGDFISSDLTRLHGPHPDLLSDFEVFCDVLEPYLLDP